MSRNISVGSNGDSSIPSYEVCCSQRTTSINFSTLASFTSIVLYMFRKKVVRVCAIPLGVVCICPAPSLKGYMVRSARRCFVWKTWYIVGCSPSGLSETLLSSRIFCSLLLCTCTVFLLGGLKQAAFSRWGPVSVIHHTCIRINGSPSYSRTFGARLVHVGIVVVFSFYRGGPTTLLGQESTFSAIVVVPIRFSNSPCMCSQLLQRYPFSIACVPSA